MLSHSQECQSFVVGKTYLAFANDVRLRRAIERTVQIVGEALTQAVSIKPSLLLSISDAQKIIGLRHRLVHAYHDISQPIIWAVVQDHLPILDQEIRNLMLEYDPITTEEEL